MIGGSWKIPTLNCKQDTSVDFDFTWYVCSECGNFHDVSASPNNKPTVLTSLEPSDEAFGEPRSVP